MPGSVLDIHVDAAPVQALLRRLQARTGDLRRPMRSIGEVVVSQVLDAFEQQQAPDGTPWEPSKRAETEGGMTLQDHGHLKNHMHSDPHRDRVEIGSPEVYAGTHQYGALAGDFGSTASGRPLPFGDIPARPFLPGDGELDWDEIKGTLLDHLLEAV